MESQKYVRYELHIVFVTWHCNRDMTCIWEFGEALEWVIMNDAPFVHYSQSPPLASSNFHYAQLTLINCTSDLRGIDLWSCNSRHVIWIYKYVAVPLSPLNKREVLKTPYIQIWCRCGYESAPR